MANMEKQGLSVKKFKREMHLLSWDGLQNEDFCDMTLACDDKEIKVHKTIIASSSPLLKNILKLNANPDPLIYLSGVKCENLESLVKFMYEGEVNVDYTALETFLEIAEDLGLEGVSENKSSDKDKGSNPSPKKKTNKKKIFTRVGTEDVQYLNKVTEESPKRKQIEEKEDNCKKENENVLLSEEPKLKSEKELDYKLELDWENVLEPKIEIEEKTFCCDDCGNKFKYKRSLRAHKLAYHDEYAQFVCDQCEYQSTNKANLKSHIKTVHNTKEPLLPLDCDKCDMKFASKKTLQKHEQTHGNEQFMCDQCDYQSTTKAKFKLHMESTHGGVRYSCKQCDYQAKTPCNLKVHVQSIHEGVRYPCDKCVYQATEKMSLKKHIQIVHDAIRYPCDKCTYQATQKRYLYKHVAKRHN